MHPSSELIISHFSSRAFTPFLTLPFSLQTNPGKALGDNIINNMDSLEERVSVFYHENSDESDNNCSDYEFNVDNDDSDAKPQRILYWESQAALLQVRT